LIKPEQIDLFRIALNSVLFIETEFNSTALARFHLKSAYLFLVGGILKIRQHQCETLV
jgi:hypothetical protein